MLTYELLKNKQMLIGFIIFSVIVIAFGVIVKIKENSKEQ